MVLQRICYQIASEDMRSSNVNSIPRKSKFKLVHVRALNYYFRTKLIYKRYFD